MQDLTNLTDLCEKVEKIDISTFHSKLVKSSMNGWTDLQVDLSEPVAAHLVYMNLNFHGHSFIIQCDISILLKSIEICKSRVVATLPPSLDAQLLLESIDNLCRAVNLQINGP